MGLAGPEHNPFDDVLVRRSARARRLSLRVSRLDGRVTLTLPLGVSDTLARKFIRGKSDWISRARAEVVQFTQVEIGARLPVQGTARHLVATDEKVARLQGDTIFAPRNQTGRCIRVWLIECARQRAWTLSREFGEVIQRQPEKITIRDTRSRWGSCSETGNIMLSWRLMLAPVEVFDYVVAHEVAHLKEMNHSRDFWSTVGQLIPSYQTPRLWLRENGTELHRYRFD